MDLSLEGNRAMLDKYKEFQPLLKSIKSRNPLQSSRGYFPYGTLEIMLQILPILDRHGIDLEQYVRGKVILDLGCGDGDLSFFLELFGPKKILAVDWGPTNYNSMEACGLLKKALESKVEVMDMDIHSFDFRSFPRLDATVCFNFLYHSPHPLWVLDNLSNRTRDLFLMTKVFDSEKSYVYFYDVGECNQDPTNWWCFTPKALALMLKRAGFRISFIERLDSNVGRSDPVDVHLDGRVLVGASSTTPSGKIHVLWPQ